MPYLRSLTTFGVRSAPSLSRFPAKVAVIDLGSNSLRLVLYAVRGRYFSPEHNERIQCGLAYGMDEDGCIDDDRIAAAKAALLRFLSVARCRGVEHTVMFATSALRDAANADDFLSWARQASGMDIRVLTGEEEALYAALGIVQAHAPERAVIADLGGGSLELCGLTDTRTMATPLSLPLGPLRFVPEGGCSKSKLLSAEHAISAFPFAPHKGAPLYLIGGAFRNIAKFHILSRDYPLHIMDDYRIAPAQLRKTLRHLQHMSPTDASAYKSFAKKRAPYIPYVAALLDILMRLSGTEEVIFSSSGVREGMVFSMLPAEQRKQSISMAALEEMRKAMNIKGDYAAALYDALDDIRALCKTSPDEMRFLCALKEYTAYQCGDFRGDIVFHQTLYSPFLPLPHRRRVFITLALVRAYVSDMAEIGVLMGKTLKLLSDDERYHAVCLGKAFKAMRALSGNCPSALRSTRIHVNRQERVLDVAYDPDITDLVNRIAQKRITALAESIGLEPDIHATG